MKIGITGLHGVGKTTISKLFSRNGYELIKNPFSFSSEMARDLADDPNYDDLHKAMVFFEDRVRCFLEFKNNTNYIIDRWWLDVCLNVDIDLFKQFSEFYTTPLFCDDFVGIYLKIDPNVALKREDIYSLDRLQNENKRFSSAISYLKQSSIVDRFNFISIDVGTDSVNELYSKIVKKIQSQ